MSLEQEHWRKVKELVNSALEREPKDRGEFIAVACASDPALRRDVESMVARATDGNGILSRPIWDAMGIDADETITILRGASPPTRFSSCSRIDTASSMN